MLKTSAGICWLRFSILYKKENQYRGKYSSMVLIMKYLAWYIFSQHCRFERKNSPSCPNQERRRYEGARGRSSDIRYQEEEEEEERGQKWRRTPLSGYEVGSSSQPDLYQPGGVYVPGADQYSQSLDYYHQQHHKYFWINHTLVTDICMSNSTLQPFWITFCVLTVLTVLCYNVVCKPFSSY